MLEGKGLAAALAAETGFDDAKLELLGVAVVLPRPVHGPDTALADPLPPRLHGRLHKAKLVLQHGDGRAAGAPVRKAPLELGGAIPVRQINPLTQKAPIGGAGHCLFNYKGSLHDADPDHNPRLRLRDVPRRIPRRVGRRLARPHDPRAAGRIARPISTIAGGAIIIAAAVLLRHARHLLAPGVGDRHVLADTDSEGHRRVPAVNTRKPRRPILHERADSHSAIPTPWSPQSAKAIPAGYGPPASYRGFSCAYSRCCGK